MSRRGGINHPLCYTIVVAQYIAPIHQNQTQISRIMDMLYSNRITIDPDICHGKPVVRGLRYPVETILELLSSGMTTAEILADYEDLEQEDILAVLGFATRLSQIKRIQPIMA